MLKQLYEIGPGDEIKGDPYKGMCTIQSGAYTWLDFPHDVCNVPRISVL